MRREIYCCQCAKLVQARLTSGYEIYHARADLHELHHLPFWKCDTCKNHVGCHHKNTGNPTHPLGVIPTERLRQARRQIHAILDPLWQTGRLSRKEVYAKVKKILGRSYHTAQLRTIEEARAVYKAVLTIKQEMNF